MAVVVTFNRLPLLQRLVDRLAGQHRLAEILVVDNASTDGTGEWLAARAGVSSGPRVVRCRCSTTAAGRAASTWGSSWRSSGAPTWSG
ncbi:MAG: glycosyltransferase [Nocardioides sp.]